MDYRDMIVLCYRCHLWWHETPCESGMWFRSTFPGMWNFVCAEKMNNAGMGKIPISWYREWIEWYKEQASVES